MILPLIPFKSSRLLIRHPAFFAVSAFLRSSTPSTPDRMGFGVEHEFLYVKSLVGSEQEIEVLERFSEQKAVHIIRFFLCDNVAKTGICHVCSAVTHEILKHLFAHFQILRVF